MIMLTRNISITTTHMIIMAMITTTHMIIMTMITTTTILIKVNYN